MLAEDPAGMENPLAKLLLFLRLALASSRPWPALCGQLPWSGSTHPVLPELLLLASDF